MSLETTGPARRALGSMVVVLLLLVGCDASGGEEPVGLDTPEATTDQTPEATPTADEKPTPAPSPTEHRFPEAGLTVIEPVAASDAESSALAVYVEFVRHWRQSLRDVELSGALPRLAVGTIINDVEDSLKYQEEHGIRYSGEMVVTPTVEKSGDAVVVLDGCADVSALTLLQDGEERPIDGVAEHPEMPFRVVLGNDGTGWTVNENTFYEDESC